MQKIVSYTNKEGKTRQLVFQAEISVAQVYQIARYIGGVVVLNQVGA